MKTTNGAGSTGKTPNRRLSQAMRFLGLDVNAPLSRPTELRVGQGFDIHPFSEEPSRRLVLGGITIDGSRGLVGHSDADAVAHAITDALLGAAGLGDIGQHFPDTDPTWKGADSMKLLAATVSLVRSEGWSISNVDTSVVLEAPKLAPHRSAMMEALSSVVGAPVSVKAKRAEGLGSLGRREGIACFAVALITR
jgi:2-C-methyl-D-erythritol 2,4-cyclodiphosphate synthase